MQKDTSKSLVPLPIQTAYEEQDLTGILFTTTKICAGTGNWQEKEWKLKIFISMETSLSELPTDEGSIWWSFLALPSITTFTHPACSEEFLVFKRAERGGECSLRTLSSSWIVSCRMQKPVWQPEGKENEGNGSSHDEFQHACNSHKNVSKQILQRHFPFHSFNSLMQDVLLIYHVTALFLCLVCLVREWKCSIFIGKLAYFIFPRLKLVTSWRTVTDLNVIL